MLPQVKGILGFDKFQHLFAYLVLSAAVGLWISPASWRKRRVLGFFLTAVIASIYGVADEIHQYFTPGRDCNIWDWIADTLGTILGAAAIMWINTCLLDKIKARFGAAS
jgi:VanZ family protein